MTLAQGFWEVNIFVEYLGSSLLTMWTSKGPQQIVLKTIANSTILGGPWAWSKIS